jgi:hypothetical protein
VSVVLGVVAALAAPTELRAQQVRAPRVAVGPFTGERSAITRGMVASVFSDHVGEIELCALGDYNSAADRLGVGGQADEAAVVTVARDLRLESVVTGFLERRPNRGYRLMLKVMRGADGTTAVTQSWEFDRIEEITALGTEIWDRLSPSLRQTPPRAAVVAGSRPPAGASRDPDAAGASRDPAGGRRAPSAGADEAPSDVPGLGFLQLRLGGGIAGRSWRIPVLGERTTRGYENNMFGELQAAVALLYRFNNQRMGFGGEAAIGVPVGLSSQGRDAAGQPVPLASSGLELLLGLTFATRPAGGGMMRFSTGMILQTFSIDTARLPREMQLALTSYIGLRVAGEGMIPFYARRDLDVGLLFGGELRWVGVGADLKEAFGDNPGTTFGLGAWFGLATRLDRFAPGLGLRLTAEFVRYRTAYAGPAALGTASDVIDDYTRFMLGVTYDFGADHPRRPDAAREGSSFLSPAAPRARGAPVGDPYGPR